MNFAKIGRQGEDLAKGFFTGLGYRFIESNYRNKSGEIDLIFIDGGVLVLAEVKTRTKWSAGEPELLIDKRKANRILKCAEIYITNTELQFTEVRIDALFVEIKRGGPVFKHIKSFY